MFSDLLSISDFFAEHFWKWFIRINILLLTQIITAHEPNIPFNVFQNISNNDGISALTQNFEQMFLSTTV